MKLHQLRDALAVADFGSLRAASRELNISQSTITKSIQQLERELDVPLFERHKRGVIVTQLGAAFLQRARAASSELDRARDELLQLKGLEGGAVTISLSAVPHLAVLPEIVRPFLQRYPGVRLTVNEALGFHSAEPHLRSGAIDAYVGVEPTTSLPVEFLVEPLFSNPRRVVARVGHPQATATSLSELVDSRWVTSSTRTADGSFASLFRSHGLPVPTRLTMASGILTQLVLLQNSDMLMIGPCQLLDSSLYEGKFVEVRVKELKETPSIVLVRRSSAPLTPAAEFLCDLVRRCTGRLKIDKQ